MDVLKTLATIKSTNEAQKSNNLTEAAKEQESKLADAEKVANGIDPDTGEPIEEPEEGEHSFGTSNPGLKAHGVEIKGAIDMAANTRRMELENTMVSNYLRTNPDSTE